MTSACVLCSGVKKEITGFYVKIARHVDFSEKFGSVGRFMRCGGIFLWIFVLFANSLIAKNGQKWPFLIIFSQCKRIPSPRGHQLHVKNRDFLVFFHLFFWGFWNGLFCENSDGLIKSLPLRGNCNFYDTISFLLFFGFVSRCVKKEITGFYVKIARHVDFSEKFGVVPDLCVAGGVFLWIFVLFANSLIAKNGKKTDRKSTRLNSSHLA